MERVYIFSGDCLSMGEVKLTQQRIRGEPGQVDVLSSEKCNSLQSGERLTIRELIVDLVEVEHQVIQDPKPSQLREAVRLIDGRAVTEASGGVSLQTVRAIAETGVDWISVGALTHSARSLDLGLDFQ